MKSMRIAVIAAAAVVLAAGTASAKMLLEKSIYFVTENGKVDSSKYWTLYIGNYPATLVRKFPGEDSLPVNTEVNLTVLSSGYIEGYGYCKKGRVDCMGTFLIDTGRATLKVPVDSVEYVVNEGARLKAKGMPLADLKVDVEGNMVPSIKRLKLTRYKLVTEYEERNLKPLPPDLVITMFAFSKAALAAAQKAAKEPRPEPKPEQKPEQKQEEKAPAQE
jgi:hypothetical protein